MRVVEEFQARGHPNITATHRMTFEITKEHDLTRRGDCVIAVRADKGLLDLSSDFRRTCRNERALITVDLEAGGILESIQGTGNPKLTLDHPTELVGRKSTYVSDRTLMIRADKAACDISREFVLKLKSRSTLVKIRLIAELA